MASGHYFEDVKEVFESVIASGRDGKMAFSSHSEAVKWRMRANRTRVTLRRMAAKMHNIPFEAASTKYDEYELLIKDRAPEVHIKKREAGTLMLESESLFDTPVTQVDTDFLDKYLKGELK
jgi:hypothetical protein